jgi:hypothetical protein
MSLKHKEGKLADQHFLTDEAEENEEEESISNEERPIKYNEDEQIILSEGVSESEDEVNKEEESRSKSNANQEENMIEIEEDIINKEDIENKIHEFLFCVQGIGKYTDKERTIYEKGQFCEPSLRDIHRFLRKDNPDNPACKYNLLKWKIIENDLIPLVLNYENNEKIQQLGLVIMIDVTEKLKETVENRSQYEQLLTELHECIANSKILDKLSDNLAEATSKLKEVELLRNEIKARESENMTEEDKGKSLEIKRKIAETENKSEQTIELIFVFIKQVLNIYQSEEILRNIENNVKIIKKLSGLKIFDAIVFHCKAFEIEFYKRLSSTLLELIYFITRIFSVPKIFEVFLNNGCEISELQKLREAERKEKEYRQSLLSTRPNKFGTMIKVKRPHDDTSFLVSNVNMLINNPTAVINQKMNIHAEQKHRPKRNLKNKKLDAKIGQEIYFINNLKIDESSKIDSSHKDIIISLKAFCEQFLKHSFNVLVKFFYFEISRLSENLEQDDIYNYISFITFFLDYHRYLQHHNINEGKKKNVNIEFDVENIREALAPEIIDFVYGYLNFNQALHILRV